MSLGFYELDMDKTVRVAADGTVTRGVAVPHQAANIHNADYREVAAPKRHGKSLRFAPAGIPKGVDLSITTPHDCRNHLLADNEAEAPDVS